MEYIAHRWGVTELPKRPIPRQEALNLFNQRFVYIIEAREVLDMQTGHRMSAQAFMNEVHRNKFHLDSDKPKGTAKAWMDWPERNELDKYTFAPGEEQVFEGAWNFWKGSGLAPIKGDISPWGALLDHLFQGLEEDRIQFEKWLAYPLQHLGAKLHTAVLLCGGQGIGKSLLTDTMRMLYGHDSAVTISNFELQSEYNSWAAHRQLVVCDEIVVPQKEREVLAERFKSWITNHEIYINDKFVRRILLPNRMNLIFTSNSREALKIEEDDRRYFVIESSAPPVPEELRRRFLRWRDGEIDPLEEAMAAMDGEFLVPGPNALLYHLMTLDSKGFDPYAAAPTTAAKAKLLANTSPPHVNWLREVKSDPDEPVELITAEELWGRYKKETSDGRLSLAAFSHAMSALKFAKAGNGVRVMNGKKNIWILKNAEKYKDMSSADIGRAYIAEESLRN